MKTCNGVIGAATVAAPRCGMFPTSPSVRLAPDTLAFSELVHVLTKNNNALQYFTANTGTCFSLVSS